MIKLNIGCGNHYAQGWTNTDITYTENGPTPDIITSADDLPFKDNTVDVIYVGHVLEHIEFDTIPKVLEEFKRVLSPNGRVMIVGPDLDIAIKDYPEAVEGIRYGAGRWSGDEHLWESRASTMKKLLVDCNWEYSQKELWEIDTVFWPLTSQIGWQFALLARPA